MKMKMNMTSALVAIALLGGAMVPGAAYSGSLLKANGVSTEADAIRYYQTIDPNNRRLTQAAWRTENGFNPDSGNEVIVVGGHKNISDLGFWRRIEMVIDKRPGYVGNVAMTTFNFNTEQDAILNSNPVSIVNMEYSPGPSGDRITKFYIYSADGNQRLLKTHFDPNPATREDLFLPNGCASCHGGGRDFTNRGGKTGGGFLAFDFRVFEYNNLTTRAANEANVKKLNRGVLMTNPPSAVKSLISGLYGGKNLPRATQLADPPLPSGWEGQRELWNVVVTDCLGCHTVSEKEVLDFDYWKRNVGSFREEVLKKKLMPNSPYANVRFWSTGNHAIVEGVLNSLPPP